MTDELLQRRLGVFARDMFVAFAVLRLCEFVLYRAYPDIWPDHYWTILAIGIASVVLLAVAWRALGRIALSRRALHAIDLLLMSGSGAIFGATAILAANRHESAYTCLVYACFIVFTRTIVVPSSGRRTAVASGLAMFPLLVAGLVLAVSSTQDVPPAAFFAGAALYTGAAVAVAATGSRIIYKLRSRVSLLAPEGLELGQYKLVRMIGEGPTGAVYVASHALLRRPTAVKLMSAASDALERAVQEMSQLRHHNTVAVYDYGRTPDGAFYVAMEYVEGIGLDVLVERHGGPPTGRVVAILVQLCAALHEAHQRGFAHGNIKLSNVILCERGGACDVAKLTDYGSPEGGSTPAADLSALHALAAALGCAVLDACFAEASSAKQLLAALRAQGDRGWLPEHARAWWGEFRRTSAPFLQVPTTLAVDLRRRAAH